MAGEYLRQVKVDHVWGLQTADGEFFIERFLSAPSQHQGPRHPPQHPRKNWTHASGSLEQNPKGVWTQVWNLWVKPFHICRTKLRHTHTSIWAGTSPAKNFEHPLFHPLFFLMPESIWRPHFRENFLKCSWKNQVLLSCLYLYIVRKYVLVWCINIVTDEKTIK